MPDSQHEIENDAVSSAAPQNEERYISDVLDMGEMERGKINLIFSPCGSGKTTFIETVLKDYAKGSSQDILYLSPTCALKDAFNARGEKTVEVSWDGREREGMKQEGITAMTYAKFGHMIEIERERGVGGEERLWAHNAIICLDEMQQAVAQKEYQRNGQGNVTETALLEAIARSQEESNLVIAFSATPRKATSFMLDHFNWQKTGLKILKSSLGLRGYTAKKEERYLNLDSIIEKLDPSERGLIYIDLISQVKDTVEKLEARGVRAVGIWSERNEQKMSAEQLKVKNTLVNEERLQEDIQVLIINAAYQTGLNIDPEKSHLDYIVIHNSNEDVQTQARGRYRGDIDVVYLRSKDDYEVDIPHDIVVPYLGRRLRKDDTDRLCDELDIRDGQGRRCKWPTVRKYLEKQGYTIAAGKSGYRFHIIEYGCE